MKKEDILYMGINEQILLLLYHHILNLLQISGFLNKYHYHQIHILMCFEFDKL